MPAMSGGAGRTDDRRPHIVVVDDDVTDLELLNAEITGRYGDAYGIVVAPSPGETLMALEAMQQSGRRVAVVLARQWTGEMNGADLLARLRTVHPRAKRVLLVSPGEWGEQRTADAIRAAIASGCVDHYLTKPLK